jgi:catalase
MMRRLLHFLVFAGLSLAACPYIESRSDSESLPVHKRQESPSSDGAQATEEFLQKFYLNDNDTYITTDSGTPIADQNSLSAGERGPTLLEDFIFRQKIQRFDHERVPERAVHARGAGMRIAQPPFAFTPQ